MNSKSAKVAEAHHRQFFLEGVNADFTVLRNDRDAWGEEQSERAAWDATLVDDLRED